MTSTLKDLKLFEGVPKQQIEWLEENGDFRTLSFGTYLFKPRDPIDQLFILLDGKIAFRIKQDNQFNTLGIVEPEGITGFLPYSRAKDAIGYGEVIEDAEIFALSKVKCKEMASKFYEITAIFVHEMTNRTRELTRNNLQSEKMMALGKLSAGLAHELNNPASAIARSAKELKKHLGTVPEKFKSVISIKASADQIDKVNNIIFEKITNNHTNELSLLERSNLENDLEDWFDEHDIENAYDLTDILSEYEFQIEDLERIFNAVPEEDFPPTIDWVVNVLTTEKMVEEIQEAADRISTLVKSVKTYTHMDQAPERIPSDIRQGINSTLRMLDHKMKAKNISTAIHYEENLKNPKIIVNEINQVWTNILDNAIDAVKMNGTIAIEANNYNDYIRVNLTDDGMGIPKDKISRIFEPFYTTKAIGEGTGMGLELVYRIIKQHKGRISVESKPGKTTFTVDLPI